MQKSQAWPPRSQSQHFNKVIRSTRVWEVPHSSSLAGLLSINSVRLSLGPWRAS